MARIARSLVVVVSVGALLFTAATIPAHADPVWKWNEVYAAGHKCAVGMSWFSDELDPGVFQPEWEGYFTYSSAGIAMGEDSGEGFSAGWAVYYTYSPSCDKTWPRPEGELRARDVVLYCNIKWETCGAAPDAPPPDSEGDWIVCFSSSLGTNTAETHVHSVGGYFPAQCGTGWYGTHGVTGLWFNGQWNNFRVWGGAHFMNVPWDPIWECACHL